MKSSSVIAAFSAFTIISTSVPHEKGPPCEVVENSATLTTPAYTLEVITQVDYVRKSLCDKLTAAEGFSVSPEILCYDVESGLPIKYKTITVVTPDGKKIDIGVARPQTVFDHYNQFRFSCLGKT